MRLERNDAGHPEQNGAHERMHRTLKAETTRPPQFDLPSQQQAFDSFRTEYSQERPHEGIGMRRPAELYEPSPRSFPSVLPESVYPGHYEIRRVHTHGCIKWKGEFLFVSEALHGERVGVEEIDDGLWQLYFGPVLLGRFGPQTRSINQQRRTKEPTARIPPAGGSLRVPGVRKGRSLTCYRCPRSTLLPISPIVPASSSLPYSPTPLLPYSLTPLLP
ncbi:MAG: integrase core domain-containing protein [Gemmatimonadota bacterium]